MSLTVRLEPMAAEDFDAWSAHSRRGFADQQVASGLHPEQEAAAFADRVFAEQLPDGLATPFQHVWTVRADGRVGSDGSVMGYLWLRVRPVADEVEGFVNDVEIVPAARGRGVGRETMLAAEAAARDLGATVMRLNVFAHNTAAVRLYENLGYDVAAATMTCALDRLAPASGHGPRVELRDMTPAEYRVFRPRLEQSYAANIARAGVLTPAEARRQSAEQLAALLPRGLSSPGHLLWTAYDGAEPVGLLWLHLRERSDGLHAFGYELEVREDRRRRGYGRAVVAAALDACRALGVVSAGLSVFGFNAAARRLYEEVGFELTAQTMVKPL